MSSTRSPDGDSGHAGPADQFEVGLAWTGEQPLVPGRRYLLTGAGARVGVRVASPKYRLDAQRRQLAAVTLVDGDHGVAIITAEEPVEVTEQSEGLQLCDPRTGATAADVTVRCVLRHSTNLHWQEMAIDKEARQRMAGHRAAVVWFTGLSGSGKSRIANEVEHRLHSMGVRTYLLDGDNVRHGLNRDLGFTETDRIENIRRIGEVAKLMVDAGVVVLTAFISPFRDERWWARDLFEPGEFCEVYVDTPLAVAEERDPKGLYAKARRGELRNFTGIDSRYEPPLQPEVHLMTTALSPAESAARVIEHLRETGVLREA